MKLSKFNFRFQYGSQQVIFNAISGGLLLLDNTAEVLLEKIGLNQIPEAGLSEIEKVCLEELKRGWIVLENELDELLYLKNIYLRTKYDRTKLVLTVAPTMSCNMRCVYCFEHQEDQSGIMNDEVAAAIVKFAQRRLEVAQLLSVVWFGGEPLLALDKLSALSKSLIDFATAKGRNYSSFLYTNGTLLTRNTAKILADSRVDTVQVSIDGYGEFHDARRKLKNGRPSFGNIIENIKDCCDIINVVIKIGVDRGNVQGAILLLQELARTNLKNRVNVSFSQINSDLDPCVHYVNKTISRRDYASVYLKIIESATEFGYNIVNFEQPPKPRSLCCGHQSMHVVSVDHRGLVYKCLEDMGHSNRALCKIEDYDKFESASQLKWLDYNPIGPECEKCEVLPLCLGGCPRRSFDDGALLCNVDRYVLIDKLKRHVERLVEQQVGPSQVAVSLNEK
ncbi:MAG: radical SAM protein [Firmicutes bacterium]|nr:radical SAM protein [Bacillota bacterium]